MREATIIFMVTVVFAGGGMAWIVKDLKAENMPRNEIKAELHIRDSEIKALHEKIGLIYDLLLEIRKEL